jgi:hypothetical protein
LVVLAYALAPLLAWKLGFRALSDDDYARVTIAQEFALHPKLDPSGTSWLPFPFWLNGGAMWMFGTSLTVARAIALLSSCVSGLLLWWGACWAGVPSKEAALGSILPLFLPLIVVLTAATVPELLTASLASFALFVATQSAPRAQMVAALAISAACLSRYDVWPLVPLLVLHAGWLAFKASSATERMWLVAAIVVAPAGAVFWMVWNVHAHGSALHFLARVASYHRNFTGDFPSISELLSTYPAALVRGAPLHMWAAFLLLIAGGNRLLRRWWLPLTGGAVMLFGLVAAHSRGGAPTHHPERAVVTLWLLVSVLVPAWLSTEKRLRKERVRQVMYAWVLMASVVTYFRAHRLRWHVGASREEELALGQALRTWVPPGQRVAMVPNSYGFFATKAAWGRPRDLIALVPQRVDPRSSIVDPLESFEKINELAQRHQISWLVAGGEQGALVRSWYGNPAHELENYSLFQVKNEGPPPPQSLGLP